MLTKRHELFANVTQQEATSICSKEQYNFCPVCGEETFTEEHVTSRTRYGSPKLTATEVKCLIHGTLLHR